MDERHVSVTAPWLHVRPHHGEGVVWDARRGALLFVDVTRGRVWEASAADGRLRWFDVPGMVGAVHPAVDGSLVVADSLGIALCRWGDDGRGGGVTRRLAAPHEGRDDIRMNDANVDPAGRYLAGSMCLDARPGGARLHRLDLDGTLSTVVDSATISNGLDWSPDGTLLYYVDSPLRTVEVFDYDVATGMTNNRRVFVDVADTPGLPDGLTVDAEGGVWVAFFGGARVVRYSPTGQRSMTVHLPVGLVTSCCFGGPDLADLYVCTSTEGLSAAEVAREPAAGGIFAVRTPWRGRPGTLFRPPPAFPR